jgi:hypothetical protein
MLAFQRQIELVQEHGKKLNRLEQRRQELAKNKSRRLLMLQAKLLQRRRRAGKR